MKVQVLPRGPLLFSHGVAVSTRVLYTRSPGSIPGGSTNLVVSAAIWYDIYLCRTGDNMSDEIQDILDDLKSVEKRLQDYLNQERENINVPTPLNPFYPGTAREIVPDPRCSECGLQLSPVMGYVCSRVNCPTGLGGPSCSTGQPGHTALTLN